MTRLFAYAAIVSLLMLSSSPVAADDKATLLDRGEWFLHAQRDGYRGF
jgi:hypothetical protein